MTEAYPLHWPPGWPRTQYPKRSQFGSHTLHKTVLYLRDELRRLGAKNVVISTNIPIKMDGDPYSRYKTPDDKGVAVYFTLNGEPECFPCDRWDQVEHNIWAVVKTIEALRGLERWGSKDMVKAAFSGFKALPESGTESQIIYFKGCDTLEKLKARKWELAKKLHADRGGHDLAFIEMMQEYDRLEKKMLAEGGA